MRRIVWLLGLLAIVVVGTVWWSSRNAIRLEPLDTQRFAQMSETEQVEWLIEQTLARSKRTGAFTPLSEELSLSQGSAWEPVSYMEIDAIGMACVEYDLPHWLNRARRYMRQEADREHLMVYQAILQARKGDWQAAEQTVRRIRADAIKALAWAHLGRLRAEAGQSDAAQQSLDQARALLARPTDLTNAAYYHCLTNAISLIINYSSIPERAETAAEFVQGLHDQRRSAAVWQVNEYYRRRGDVARLRAFAALVSKSDRRDAEILLVRTLIEQGQAEAGLRLLARLGECRDIDLARIARALHRQGRTQDARTFADALRTRLLQDGFPQGHLSRHKPSTLRVSTPYGEVRVQLRRDYNTTHLLVQAYTEWGQPDAAEQLIAVLPDEYFRVLQRTNMAYVYHKMGHKAQARQHLERARTRGQQGVSRVVLGRLQPVGTSIEIGCASAMCGEHPLALEVANTIPLPEQRGIVSCVLREYVFRRNAFWERLMGFPWE